MAIGADIAYPVLRDGDIALAEQFGNLGFITDENRCQPAIDEKRGARQLHVEFGEQRDRGFSVEPVIAYNPMIDRKYAQQSAIGINPDGREVMDWPLRTLRAHKAMEMPVFGGVRGWIVAQARQCRKV